MLSIHQKQLINFISLSNLYCISYIIECMAYVKSTDKLLLSPFLAYVEHGQGSLYSKKMLPRSQVNLPPMIPCHFHPTQACTYLDTKVMRVGSDTFCDLFIQKILQNYAIHLIMLIIMEDFLIL